MTTKKRRHLGLCESQKPERFQAGEEIRWEIDPLLHRLRPAPTWVLLALAMLCCAIVGFTIGFCV